MKLRYWAALVLLFAAFASCSVHAGTFAVYHVGNSLSGDLYNLFRKVVSNHEADEGNTYTYGYHFRNATGVTWMFTNPTPGFIKGDAKALLQPFAEA